MFIFLYVTLNISCTARSEQYNAVTKLKVAQNAGNFLTSRTVVAAQVGLCTLFHGVSKLAICIRLKLPDVHTHKSRCAFPEPCWQSEKGLIYATVTAPV